MKNATPSDIAIKNILKDIDGLISYAKEFIKEGLNDASVFLIENGNLGKRFDKVLDALEQARVLGYINPERFAQIKTHFYIADNKVFESLIDVSTDYINTNKGGHIADIVERIFPQTEENLFIERMTDLKKSVQICLSKEEKAKAIIKGLAQPVKWENITLLFDGGNFVVFQDKKNLGTYSLTELNFPRFKTRNRNKELRTVRGFLLSLCSYKQKEIRHILNYQDTNNQKLKEKFVKVLQNAFQTNKDPVRKNDVDLIYEPIFDIKFSGDLGVNNFRSGKEEYDDDTEYKDY